MMMDSLPAIAHTGLTSRSGSPPALAVSLRGYPGAIVLDSSLALGERLHAQIDVKQQLWQSTPPSVAKDPAGDLRTGTDVLAQEAHRVLVRYLPGGDLPEELWKLRAMLDLHMFGRDKRVRRDDVVLVARQIDRMLASARPEPDLAMGA